ncbi:saccharopine dehydrogenase [Corynebacterium phocae]|uniref:Saccharopine dehydrogenase n=1 Tax=Corynebacterium phocae TaxID=161895 RepID=A0A1L7D325_9CORY|nr:saccharopine dehydrogenase NADP-binding domain-containing protein [Corynebacterium phocae]APT92549.1 saccharopine dehydrogenase [Corynebacterium phocae]KAA8725151.1 NAD(P)H-binding protein [Corynebacterium phocae]
MITIFGATGLVGQLTAKYLHDKGHTDVRLAGRNLEKLEALRQQVNPAWELKVADAHDKTSLEEMLGGTDVVIAVAGPYQLYGTTLVDLCAQRGVDYVDLTGEVPFIRRSIDTNLAATRDSGARIVHSCGFDSVPSDMGMFNLHRAAGKPFSQVDMVVEDLVGGISAGTLESARQLSVAAERDRAIAKLLGNRYSLNPNPQAPETKTEYQPDFLLEEIPGIGWVGPFFMAAFNTRVVRRSNALLDNVWGEQLRYREGWATGPGLKGRLAAVKLGLMAKAMFQGTRNKYTRPLVQRFIPAPGIDNARFKICHYGRTVDGETWCSTVSGQGDPGYELTAVMLAEAAETLVKNPGEGGVWTPATALGEPYLELLKAAGLNFSAARVD